MYINIEFGSIKTALFTLLFSKYNRTLVGAVLLCNAGIILDVGNQIWSYMRKMFNFPKISFESTRTNAEKPYKINILHCRK